MVQIFLTYTASKFVIYKLLLCFRGKFLHISFNASTRLSTLGEPRAQKVALQCDPLVFRGFLLGFPLVSFRNSVLPCCPFMSFPFLPFCPDFLPSLLPFWLFASCLDFYDFTLILLLIPNPFCSSLSDLSPHGHPTVPVPITNVKLQPTDPPLQTNKISLAVVEEERFAQAN